MYLSWIGNGLVGQAIHATRSIDFKYSLNNPNTSRTNEAALATNNHPFGSFRTTLSGTEKTEAWVVRESNASGTTVQYQYLGDALTSTKSRGFFGFPVTMVHDRSTGLTRYVKYEFDGYGLLPQEVVEYDQQFKQSSKKKLTHTYHEPYLRPIDFGAIDGHLRYNTRSTTLVYEQGQLLGYQQNQSSIITDRTHHLINKTISVSQSAEYGSMNNVPKYGTLWSSLTRVGVSEVQRKSKVTTEFTHQNTATNKWIVGFNSGSEAEIYKGLTLERTTYSEAEPYEQSHYVKSHTVMPGDSRYELTSSYTYTSNGIRRSETVSSNASEANIAPRTTYYRNFDQYGLPNTIENALGQVSGVTYDKRFGQIASLADPNGRKDTFEYNVLGLMEKTTSKNGIQTTYIYHPGLGKIINGIVVAYSVSISSRIAPTQTRYYDRLNRLIRESIIGLDGKSRHTDTRYYASGRVRSVSLPHSKSKAEQWTEFRYDALGRLTKTIGADGREVSTDYFHHASQNQMRVETTEVIKRDNGTVYKTKTDRGYYNIMGELVDAYEAVGTNNEVKTSYTYYGDGQLETVTVNDNISAMSHFDYDRVGYRTAISGPNIGTIRSSFNALGQLHQTTDAKNQTTTFAYDLLGRITSRTNSDGHFTWQYDGDKFLGGRAYGQVTRRTGPGFSESITYNRIDKPLFIDTTLDGREYKKVFQYHGEYDRRLSQIQYPNDQVVRYAYNSSGYLNSLSTDIDGWNRRLKLITNTNSFGQTTRETYGNGLISTRDYDPLTGRMLSQETKKGDTVIQDNDMIWFSNGNLEKRYDRIGGNKEERFSYDYLNRLTDTNTYINNTFKRSLDNRFDDYGRITSKTTNSDSTNDDYTSYIYEQAAKNAGFHAVSQVTIDGIVNHLYYDNNGNITRYDAASGDDKYIKWNASNQVTEILVGDSANDSSPTARSRFKYGPNGQRYYHERYWRDSRGNYQTQVTYYVDNYEDVLTASNDSEYSRIQKVNAESNIRLTTTTGRNGTVEQHIHYLHRDYLGSIEKITDQNGNQLTQAAMAYDPFGERKHTNWQAGLTDAQTEAMLNEQGMTSARGFTDHEHLDRTGLIHMNGRVYDPKLGRFLSPDPIVQGQTSQFWNRYSYVWNNPMKYNDPSGYSGECVIDQGCGGNSEGSKALEEGHKQSRKRNSNVRGNFYTTIPGPAAVDTYKVTVTTTDGAFSFNVSGQLAADYANLFSGDGSAFGPNFNLSVNGASLAAGTSVSYSGGSLNITSVIAGPTLISGDQHETLVEGFRTSIGVIDQVGGGLSFLIASSISRSVNGINGPSDIRANKWTPFPVANALSNSNTLRSLRILGNTTFGVGTALSLYDGSNAAINGNIPGVGKASADLAVGSIAFLGGPVSWTFGAGYFVFDSTVGIDTLVEPTTDLFCVIGGDC